MEEAAKNNDLDKINKLIENGYVNWNEGMKNTAKGGHKDLVEFFIDKGAHIQDYY